MYQTKNIHYKIIFKQDGETETTEYKAQAIIKKDKKTYIEFETQENTMRITYDKQEIELKNGDSVLRFQYDKDVENIYQVPLGSLYLKTRLKLFESHDQSIKMVYELYDQQGLILTAYLMIRLFDICESEYEDI